MAKGRILRPYPGKATAEIHDYHDTARTCSLHRWPNAPPDTPVSDSPTPAASLIHPVRAQPGKPLTHSLDNHCAIVRNPDLAPRGPNHCSTMRDSGAPNAAGHSSTQSTLTSPNKDRNRDVPHRERLRQTAPATHETRPTGPGLTCEFDGGRCWVRTNVG